MTQDALVLAVMNVSILGDFAQLSVRISQNYQVVIEETFTDAAEVLDFFDDQVFALGPVRQNFVSTFGLEWELDGGGNTASFAATALFGVVPEPSTGLMLLQGLLLIAAFRRRNATHTRRQAGAVSRP